MNSEEMVNPRPATMLGSRPTALGLDLSRALVIAVAIAVAAASGMVLLGGDTGRAALAPFVALGGVLLLYLSLNRFAAFVGALLVIRPSLDIAKFTDDGLLAVANPASVAALLFTAALLLWAYVNRHAARPHPRSGLQTACIAYLTVAAISVVGGQYLSTSAVELVTIVSGIGMFFAVDRLLDGDRSLRFFLLAIFLSAAVPLALTTYGVVTGNQLVETKENIERVTATFAQSNPFAHYLLPLILMGVAIRGHLETRMRMLLTAVLAGMLAALLLTYTRTAWIGLVVGIIVLGWAQNRALLVGLFVTVAALLVMVPSIAERATDVGDDPDAPRRESSLQWRVGYWGEVLPLLNDNPLTGIGLGGTAQALEAGKPPHNDYLRSLAETGIAGLAAYVGLVWQFIRTSLSAIRAASTGLRRGVALGSFAYAVAFAVVSIAENISNQVVLLWYIFAIMAMANWISRDGATSRAKPSLLRMASV